MSSGFNAAVAALACAVLSAAAPAGAAGVHAGLSAGQLFQLADRERDAGRQRVAETLYDALAKDPNLEVRTEARFRKGMMLAAVGRYRDAALTFRRLLDEKPGATRVRLELARVLAAMDDEPGARKALRQAQAAGLPPDVAAVVDQFASALKSQKPFGASLSLAIAPDSNINRATSAKTLDTVIAPLTLDQNAQAQSGLGFKVGGQVYARAPLSDDVQLLLQASGSATLYRQSAFDDVSASLLVGPEVRLGADRWRPAVGVTRRYYGGAVYAGTRTVTVDWLHPVNRTMQLSATASLSQARYTSNRLQDGEIGDVSLTAQKAFSSRTGGSFSLSLSRQTARDPGYATASGGISALVWKDAGRQTLFASAGFNRLGSDARLFPFRDRRQESLYRVVGGVVVRRLAVREFVPVVRLVQERNISTIGIYDYSRTSVELGVDRAF